MSKKAVTFDNQIEEVKREIAVRERVYAKWIDNGTMRHEVADKQMAALCAVLHTLEELRESEMSLPAAFYRLRTEEGMS